jgi:hypothetical protein
LHLQVISHVDLLRLGGLAHDHGCWREKARSGENFRLARSTTIASGVLAFSRRRGKVFFRREVLFGGILEGFGAFDMKRKT